MPRVAEGFTSDDFTWRDGERVVRFGPNVASEAPDLLERNGFERFALLTTERAVGGAQSLAASASGVVHVPAGKVDEVSAVLLGELSAGLPLVALGGGRVVDTAKALAGATGVRCAALPTTLSGAEMTPFHRLPAGVEGARMVRPALVIADPDLMASAPADAPRRHRHERARPRDGGALHAVSLPGHRPRGAAGRHAARERGDARAAGAHRARPGRPAGRVGVRLDRHRVPSRGLSNGRPHGGIAARRDERRAAAPLRAADGRPGARPAERAGSRARRRERRPGGRGRRHRSHRGSLRPYPPRHARRDRGAPARGGPRPPPPIRRSALTPDPPGEAELLGLLRAAL